jgi:DNA-binding GntR family transcriptional regulator
VQWATPNPTNSDIKQLETINNSLKEVIKTSETAAEDWIPLNMEFHRLFSWIAPS